MNYSRAMRFVIFCLSYFPQDLFFRISVAFPTFTSFTCSLTSPITFGCSQSIGTKQSNLNAEVPDEHFFLSFKFLPARLVFNLSFYHKIYLIGYG